MTRRSARLTLDFGALVAAYPTLRVDDDLWRRRGFARASCRVWRRQDGSFTARLVWRNRGAGDDVGAAAYTLRGVALPEGLAR